MHPAIQRMRPAQDRALHLLDVHFGPATIAEPTLTSYTERDNLELAARTTARTLLDDNMRLWLERIEESQRLDAIVSLGDVISGLPDMPTPEPTLEAPETAATLHSLVALADWLTTASVTPPEPVEPEPTPDAE